MLYYQQESQKVLADLKATQTGLTNEEVKKRQEKYGLNKLEEKQKISPWKIFFAQFKSALIVILLAATGISAAIGEAVDALVILIIVILNAVFGFIQEYKAEKAIEGLKNMMNPKSKVIRNGKKIEIDSSELTIGDILVIEEGDNIAADGRLLQVVNLGVLEASLTGESLPVRKSTEIVEQKVVLGDQKNMVFSGTAVTRGRGLAVVTAIAMQTEIGKIADMIQNVAPKETNLQKKLGKLSKWLGIVILAICAIVFLAYYFIDHESLIVAFLTAVALAVAAIPEGLPAVVTISLALGVKRMVKKNALMRRLSSVESLGSVDVICTDKTGTLTKNEMTVTKLWVDNQERKITGTGYEAKGEIRSLSGEKVSETVNRLLEIGTLCNQTSLQGRKVVGDPTEGCLLVSAAKAGIYKQNLEKKYIWLDEMPFDSSRKMMSSLYQNGNQKKLFSKGAPEILLQKCTHILLRGEVQKLDDHQKKEILKKNTSFAQDALRVLAFGYKEISSGIKESANDIAEDNLIFVGLQAMIDPPREEVKEAIQTCKEAGIRVIMITGDNIVTAQAIASELGIQGESLEGIALDDGVDIQKILQNTNIFARVNPEHKQKIIQALQNMGHVTAMTGDGVNDAPALKNADIGVAMGITGTDVSKEAADMILLDDNFATIVSAVEEGRGIFDNIRKFVNYMLSSNFGEVMVIFVMSILGLPLPLLAIQILWINLVTDGLPALALGVDPIDPHVMKRKPISPQQNILTSSMIFAIVMVGIVMTLGAYILFRQHYHIDLVQARTGVFVLLVLLEIVRIQLVRSQYGSKLLDNKRLLGAVGLSIGLVLLVVYTPLSIVFQTKPLSPVMWEQIGLILVGAVAVGSLLNLGTKRVGRRKEQATLR